MAISAIVLAGGASNRMGRDKASLPFGPETLLARVVRIARGEVDHVIVAARPGQATPDGVDVVFDDEQGKGPLAALVGALARVESPLTLVLACDMPLLKPAVVQRLIASADGTEAVVPSVDGHWMMTCAVLRTAPAAAAATPLLASGARSLRALVGRLDTRAILEKDFRDVDPGMLSFVGCNTPAEYRRALILAGLRPED